MKRFLALLIPTLLFTASLAADELLQVHIGPIQRSEDGSTATALVVLRNKAGVDITDIDVDLVLTSGGKAVTLTAADHPGWGAALVVHEHRTANRSLPSSALSRQRDSRRLAVRPARGHD